MTVIFGMCVMLSLNLIQPSTVYIIIAAQVLTKVAGMGVFS